MAGPRPGDAATGVTRLRGMVTGVADALPAGMLLVPADGVPHGLYLVDMSADGVAKAPVTSLDMTRQLCDLSFDDAPGTLIASGPAASQALDAALNAGAGILAAEQIGLAQRCLDMTVAYVKERRQFARPVGSFQGLKHRLADLWVSVTQARAASRYAAASLASGAGPNLRRREGRGGAGQGLLLGGRGERRAGMRADARRHRLHLGTHGALVPETREGGLDRVRHAGRASRRAGVPGQPARPVMDAVMTPLTDGEADLRSRVARLSLEQKVRLLTGADFWALYPEPDAGLRRVVLSDGPAGVRGETWDERDTSANVPSPTALAATWDCERVEAIGRLLAHEARRKGVDVLLAPTVNLHRTPFGGRHFECFSEDPLLTARIGVAYVRGLQNSGVGATVKHFIGNDSETERMTVDVRIDERTLRELYLAPFEAIVREAGAWSVMASYNGVNGATMTESPLLRDILHDEWGYDGLVMSDWTAARSTEPAARAALDLAMPGPASRFGPWGDALVEAVQDGRVDEALIDDKVLRILRLAARVGGLTEVPAPPAPAAVDIADELRAAAAASFVLARNHDLLPLSRSSLRRVAVIGPNAEVARTLGGGSATVFPPYTVSPLEGLRAAGLDVAFAPGTLGHLRTSAARAPWLLRPDGFGLRCRGPVLLALR